MSILPAKPRPVAINGFLTAVVAWAGVLLGLSPEMVAATTTLVIAGGALYVQDVVSPVKPDAFYTRKQPPPPIGSTNG